MMQVAEENTKLMKVKERISTIKENLGMPVITSPELLVATQEEHELRKSFHPGFVISFDNFDFQLNKIKTTTGSTTKWWKTELLATPLMSEKLILRICKYPKHQVSSQFVQSAESMFGLHNFDIKNFSLIL